MRWWAARMLSQEQPTMVDNGDGTWTVTWNEHVQTFTTDEMKNILEPYPPYTDEELSGIADGMIKRTIFTSSQCPNRDIASVFMGLSLADFCLILKMKLHNITFFYEYMSEAAPVSVNGYPVFFSMHIVSQQDAEKVIEYYNERANLEN